MFLGNQRDIKQTGLGDFLMRLLSIPTSADFEYIEEMGTLVKIMRELKVDKGLPKSPISYDQVKN